MSKSLTSFLKQIGDEKVSIVVNGKVKKVSRTEALARRLYVMAMGGIEQVVAVDGTITEVVHKANHKIAKDIREYTEGKAAIEPAKEKEKGAKPGQFTSETASRLNDRLGGASERVVESVKLPIPLN